MIRLFVVLAFVATLTGSAACSSGTSSQSCAKSTDALEASFSGASTTDDINAADVTSSLRACGGPATWRLYAKVDHVGETIGSMGDMNDPTMSSSTALDFLCSRFDANNSTDTCKGR
jgi:hypothetical protein